MTIFINEGLLKITQKLCLIASTIYLYTIFSSEILTCPQIKNSFFKIHPFDNQFFISSVLFLTGASISIVECDIWPYNTKPKNRIIQFLAEVIIYLVDKLISFNTDLIFFNAFINVYYLTFNTIYL